MSIKSILYFILFSGPVYCPNASTLADGLAVPQVGYNAYATITPILDKMIVVKEEWIALAILRLVELEKVVVEELERQD